ncbi:MAG: hypothetical protein ACLFTD_07485 [Halochromatium sp.]
MKSFILSASAATLALASMTAAAWWATPPAPYWSPYAAGAPYAIAPPSSQQLQELAERRRKAAMERMESMPAFGERPTIPGMPALPAFGERPPIPEMPAFGERPAIPEMPAMPEIPGYDERPSRSGFSLNREERRAEIDASRSALKQHAEERRAALQAIAEQRRSSAEQRRQDWRCARQLQRPMPIAHAVRDCAPAGNKPENDSSAESGDQTAASAAASNKTS